MQVTTQPEAVPQPLIGGPFLGNQVSVEFAVAPGPDHVGPNHTLGLTLPGRDRYTDYMRAVTAETATGANDEFLIGLDADQTAQNFETALNTKLEALGETELAGASSFAAAQNFFNGLR